jgi:ubiquinone/menaquinone biosynthesis C-methylase UbiE
LSTTNNEQYKINQRQGWNGVADEWLKCWDVIEPASKNISLRMIELANIKEGSKILDVATGIGEPSITAAYQVGKNGRVLATHISLKMLSISKQRSITLGLDDRMDFKEGDAETIVLPPLSFDAALCRFGIMFLPDIKAV